MKIKIHITKILSFFVFCIFYFCFYSTKINISHPENILFVLNLVSSLLHLYIFLIKTAQLKIFKKILFVFGIVL